MLAKIKLKYLLNDTALSSHHVFAHSAGWFLELSFMIWRRLFTLKEWLSKEIVPIHGKDDYHAPEILKELKEE